MTPTFKELADGLREAGEGVATGPWVSGAPLPLTWVQATGGSVGGHEVKRDYFVCEMRGWGHLTGQGGLALDEKEAFEIQQQHARFIAHCGTNANAIIEALERANELEELSVKQDVCIEHLLANIEWLEEVHGVGPIEEDAAIVYQIKKRMRERKDARAALKGGE